MYVYCLFCLTAKCDKVARLAERLTGCRALYPKQIQHTRSNGRIVDIEHPLLPGYVFLYSEDQPLLMSRFWGLEGVLRCICDDKNEPELTGDDEAFALMLLEKGGIIGKTPVFVEGQMIRVCKGAYCGLESRVLKVNRRNMRMQIEIPFANRMVKTWVEYEIVENKG